MRNAMRRRPLKVCDVIKDVELFKKAIKEKDCYTTRGGVFKGVQLRPKINKLIVKVYHKKEKNTIYYVVSPLSFRAMVEKMNI